MNPALIALPFLAFSSPAVATAAVGLAYDAPVGCPTQTDFVIAVAARGADFDGERPGEAARTMLVAIHKRDEGFAGEFQVREGQTTTAKREVNGASCGEVAEALAVVTAIELRPAGAAAPAPAAVPPPANAPPPEPPAIHLRGRTQAFPARTESLQVGAGTLRFDLQRGVTAYAGATVGLIPSLVVPRFDLAFTMANFVTTPEGEQRIAGLIPQLRVSFLGPATYASTDSKTDMNGIGFGIGLCQSPLYDTRGLVLLFCAEYGGGIMDLRTKDANGARVPTKSAGFGTVGFTAQAQYNFGSWFHIGAKLEGGLTIGPISGERADGSRIFESSMFNANAMLGAGAHY